ncbi:MULTISPECIES: hypothetical protein [unclassified Streptomyces]|uniref:hypothetical protein n=1 Tax=unclassified Streptomyces TaxID=2593676 RepID=UPI003701ACCB
MRFELRRAGEADITPCAEGAPGRSVRDLLDDDASLIHVFDADGWELAMARHHAYMGVGTLPPRVSGTGQAVEGGGRAFRNSVHPVAYRRTPP